MNAAARLAIAKCDECDADTLRDYIRAGLVLVPIPAGSKAPHGKGWNLRARCWAKPGQVPGTYTGNVGLAHAYAGTCALDIDDAALAAPALAAYGIDLAALLAAPGAVHIRSGRAGRDKLLFRLRDPLPSINRSAAEGFELRCAATNGRTVQDVLPPSIHPDTGKPYQWAGDWRAIPNAPADLLTAWRGMLGTSPAPRTLPQPMRPRSKLPDAIPEGERNATLLSLAAGLVRRGYGSQAVNDRLQRINAERCTPPLGADVVDSIVARATGYGSDGFAMLPHKLLDSREWKALPPRAHDIIVLAFRRYGPATAHAGFALTWADFAGRPGFAKKDTFYTARGQAVASRILLLLHEARNTQTGCTPDLFTIAPDFASPEKVTLRQSRKSTPLHIRTALDAAVHSGATGANKPQRGATR
jgi:hypothetical protein